jgi:predicted ATPase
MNKEVPLGFRVLQVKGDRLLFLNQSPDPEKPSVTVLLGENGVGKSRLLGNIAKSFLMAETFQAKKKKKFASRSDNIIPKFPCVIDYQTRGKRKVLDETVAPINMPRALIAVSMSAFHKFPSNSHSSRSVMGKDVLEAEFYHLIGTDHNSLGRSAFSTALNSLVGNFSLENHDSGRVSHVLSFLKYQKKLTIEFARRISKRDLESLIVNPQNFIAEYTKKLSSGGGIRIYEQRLRRFLETAKPSEVKKLISLIKKFNDFFPSGAISIHFDFEKQNKDALDKLKIISKLTQFGIASPRDLLLFRDEDDEIRLAEASSGELVITTIILGIANAIQKNSLILIDEPEISLHPAWQQTFLRLLLEAFAEFKSCHFIIATHSPLIVSEASDFDADVISMSAESDIDFIQNDSAHRSIEQVMLETFKVPTVNNRYLLERLTDLTKLAATHKITPEQFNISIGKYALQVSRMKENDPQRELFALMKSYGEKYAIDK